MFTSSAHQIAPSTPFQPGAAAPPATQVEISVACRNLQDKDVFSKSDPMCVLYANRFGQAPYTEYGRTEVVKNSLKPDFLRKFTMSYYFEESQKLKFEIYDVDSESCDLDKQDFLGSVECTLGEIVGSPYNTLERKLSNGKNSSGKIIVRAEELSQCKEVLTLQFHGIKLDKKDIFGLSDPYLVISRSNEDLSFTIVHKTEVIKNSLNPTWRPFNISVRALAGGDYDRSIQFECYDWNRDGNHELIGLFMTTVREICKGAGAANHYELINDKKRAKKRSYHNSGEIILLSLKSEMEFTFLDYIQGGMDLNFTVAIDFTASNLEPTDPKSLHYLNAQQPSSYAQALQAVGEIIQDYDSDKLFPALGFGARIPPNGEVSHEFFLNGDTSNPYCPGIPAILQAYYRTLQTVQLYGPTNFAPVIYHVARFAEAYRDGSHYFVLLILTDGVITDMPQTKQAIVSASTLPMSIIIIGIGDADFTAMEQLDADEQTLSTLGRDAERDIVQFVPFRDFISDQSGSDIKVTQACLAKEVLAEIPGQIIGYMKAHDIKPNLPTSKPNTADNVASPNLHP